MSTTTSITLCMGSSCFSRGNGKNLPRIQEFLKDHGLAAKVTLKGCRCGGCCAQGPNIWVDGVLRPNLAGPALDAFLASLLPLTPHPNSSLLTPHS